MSDVDRRLEARVPPDNEPGHHPDEVPDKPLVPPEQYRVRKRRRSSSDRVVTHPFLFDPWFLPVSAPFGVIPSTTSVVVDDDELRIRFGPWRLVTPRSNVAWTEPSGPYHLLKVVGPPHLSFRDLGITFATNRRQGLCIGFVEPVPGIEPTGHLRHPAATVTVADPASLARDLERRG